ncbi:hypothetical protein OGAPHI_005847 [Ogataea philodendri]|uniref:Zinc finger Mcm10/DnaG-type domain-containing protein n=1 Tax=Ogataea philodendri TaxID=1378263 RepID=A0A9P8NZK2_9ASCO|nr:uncharacterized protein OGAPHI_005847 [Ogataea philodendri]KAH3662595.1 hypothetical protein OGAPHI_005847 [Ogataea philodendri]
MDQDGTFTHALITDQMVDLSDLEDNILDQLHQIRELKEQKKSQALLESDEEDPRERDQTPYFRKQRALETRIRQKIKATPVDTSSFAQRLENFNQKLSTESSKRRQLQEQIQQLRVSSFDHELLVQRISKDVDEVDEFSKNKLSKRYYSSESLTALFKDIQPLRVHHTLAKIHPPNFESPNYANYAVVGVVVSKSEAKQTSNDKSKYMSVQLSNFKQNITLTLFAKAFKKYYKLRLGDVIAVLNPQIWVFKERSGFALSLKEDYDTILEIGHSKDFGLCKALKKDGSQCNSPIDTSKTQYCDYHTELSFNRTASKRLELTGSSKMFTPSENGVKQAMYLSTKQKNGQEVLDGQLVDDAHAPKENLGRLYFSNPDASKAFFDDSYSNPRLIADISAAKTKVKRAKNERRLREKLAGISGGDSLKDTGVQSPTTQKAVKVAFDPKTMTKIGFNPTKRLFEKKKDHEKSQHKSELVAELLSTAKTQKSLGRSKEDIKRRKLMFGKKPEQMIELSSSDDE